MQTAVYFYCEQGPPIREPKRCPLPDPLMRACISRPLAANLDIDRNGYVTKDELRKNLPMLTNPEDMKNLNADDMVQGFMDMLDQDGDGVGSKKEFLPFVKILRDMDGRMDRLPASKPAKKEGPKTKKKPSKARSKTSPEWAKDHDEL
jgi:hypothetical protein